MNYLREKEEIVYYMQRLYQKGLTTCTGGNISVLTGNKEILITPSGLDKGRLAAKFIVHLNDSGENLTPACRPSMEVNMHRAIYRQNPYFKTIIHAHPHYSTLFSVAGKKINTRLTGETYAIAGDPAYVPYKIMASDELAMSVAMAFENAKVVVMQNHGVVTAGDDLSECFNRLEVLESAAHLCFNLATIGGAPGLSNEETKRIDELLKKIKS